MRAWLQRWAEEAFYVWTYELPTSPWFYVGAGALVVLVLMMCLFPLAPYQVRPPPPPPRHTHVHAIWEGLPGSRPWV